MAIHEMTIADTLRDPLIRQVMKADGVSLQDMEKLLRDTAARARRHREVEALQAPCR